jgi:hypothetical protein
MFDPFERMSSEQIFYTMSAGAIAAMLFGAVIIREARHSIKPLPEVNGGASGAILKIKPSLNVPTGDAKQ